MARATWNGAVLAESEETVIVEGNHYFPRESVRMEFFLSSETHTICPWKGKASYHHVEVNGKRNPDAAWYYPEPFPAASQIKDRIAFWKGVKVEP
jgi:uncharacterized protein (DUF427 family)